MIYVLDNSTDKRREWNTSSWSDPACYHPRVSCYPDLSAAKCNLCLCYVTPAAYVIGSIGYSTLEAAAEAWSPGSIIQKQDQSGNTYPLKPHEIELAATTVLQIRRRNVK